MCVMMRSRSRSRGRIKLTGATVVEEDNRFY